MGDVAGPAPVRISYKTLLDDPASVRAAIEAGLGSGPGALGLVVIGDLPPEFPAARERLFRLGAQFASLPEPEREECARPETSYFFGWSHGKEVMNGKPDTAKGSFYANPLLDRPAVSDSQRAAHPEYYAGNVWPANPPELEPAFKALGKVVADVGLALARACDGFDLAAAAASTSSSDKIGIANLIAHSQSNKARLLHYYPQAGGSDGASDDACGVHLDHSILTGLCSAMYLDTASGAVVGPNAGAGLYIYPRGVSPRDGQAVKVSIPVDCLAFQTGEAVEILTDGRLRATPHYVSAGQDGTGVSRETFAFFLQPDVDDVIGSDGETFGQFTKRIIERHYGDENVGSSTIDHADALC
ncbi:uncharacterized protein EHS24_002588 [Apiotrichum porosum]|uniref:Uncharacterized protein n=1 Tax=Apiotrichum porosum TaxID=105984 RepID=A0A427XH26_9TREE|nr:uncharacterized protein EHS24_002588 [Apiotrichum porosum]RSH78132.1 hypothetical protein EHS24_002588 [Apiotrichum porosum]